MDALRLDLRTALRRLLAAPGFTLVAVLTLALGIGANTAIFSLVHAVLLRPLPYPHPERLVQVRESDPSFPSKSVSYPNFEDHRRQQSAFEDLGVYRTDGVTLSGQGDPEVLVGARVSESVLRLLGTAPALGRTFAPEEDRPGAGGAVVLGHELWLNRFGGRPDVVGRSLVLDGRPHVVVGVMPAGFAFPPQAQLWVPAAQAATPQSGWLERGNHPGLSMLGRLKPGFTLFQGTRDLEGVAARLAAAYPDSNAQSSVRVRPLGEAINGSLRTPLLLLMGAVGLVLLIACANVANLTLARALARQREMAVRTALGARAGQLLRQVLVESVVVHLIGAAAGLALATWGLQLLTALVPASVPTPLTQLGAPGLSLPVLLFTAGLALASGLVFGLVPALQAIRVAPADAMKEGSKGTAGPGRRRVRLALVASEVALATVLLVGAGLLTRSLKRVLDTDPGFRGAGVQTLQVRFPEAMSGREAPYHQVCSDLLARITALPGVESAALSNTLPLLDDSSRSFQVAGEAPRRPGEQRNCEFKLVAGDLLKTLRIPLRRGRGLDASDLRPGPAAGVVDQAFADQCWPGQDPLGKLISIGDEAGRIEIRVVGVVDPIRTYSLDAATNLPEVYLPLRPEPGFQGPRDLRVLVRTSRAGTAALHRELLQAVRTVSPELAVTDLLTMDQVMRDSLAPRRLVMALVGGFSLLALVLAAVGIYGVTAFSVEERTREIGIRMALGAQVPQVLGQVLRQSLRPVALGLGLGFASVLGLRGVLASQLYGTPPSDPATHAGALALLAAVAALACLVPACRALRVDPATALRQD